MHSEAKTVSAYLAGLPDDRRAVVEAVRTVILANLPAGLVESVAHGMLAYAVPLSTYPDTYNGEPLMYAALASQKRHLAVYLMGIYGSDGLRERFVAEYRATGKKLDMGKSCVRFATIDDLPLDVIGRAIGAMTCEEFVALAKAAREASARKRGADTTD